MKIAQIVGARPQFIKAGQIHREIKRLQADHANLNEILIHTGQHYSEKMSQFFFDELELPKPDYYLGIGGLSHGAMTGRMVEKIEEILLQEKPDWVVVHGDTNSTIAGALASSKIPIPLAHVEAGLRSFNRKMPEEINRIVTDHCSDLLFVPSSRCLEQLLKEGVEQRKIHDVGDVMYDAINFYKDRAQSKSSKVKELGLTKTNYILATVHRQENVDDPDRLQTIFRSLSKIADDFPVVIPLHPRTEKALLKHHLLDKVKAKFHVLQPVGYFDMIQLETNAKLIVTDSGGVQKEAYYLHIPCLILREETEWAEMIQAGTHELTEINEDKICQSVQRMIGCEKGLLNKQLYGDGSASTKILSCLMQ